MVAPTAATGPNATVTMGATMIEQHGPRYKEHEGNTEKEENRDEEEPKQEETTKEICMKTARTT
jgi:hypothetical protein